MWAPCLLGRRGSGQGWPGPIRCLREWLSGLLHVPPYQGPVWPTSSGLGATHLLPSSPKQTEWELHSGCGRDPTYQNKYEVCGASRLREEGSNGAPGPRAGAGGRVSLDGSSSCLSRRNSPTVPGGCSKPRTVFYKILKTPGELHETANTHSFRAYV